MDERQEQVQVGAGLQESRLNTDLINWLEKWGTHILTVVALIVLAYVGLDYYGKYQDGKTDDAFAAYEAARGVKGGDGILTGSPDNLVLVAQEHDGWASVYELAKLDAAEIWLGSAVRGLAPGADLQNITEPDTLKDEQIEGYLASAQTHYADVLSRVEGNDDMIVFELRALDGLAAVAESQGRLDDARGFLNRLRDRASGKYDRAVLIAESALAAIDDQPADLALVSEEQLPESATPNMIMGEQFPGGDASQLLTPIADPFANPPAPTIVPVTPTETETGTDDNPSDG